MKLFTKTLAVATIGMLMAGTAQAQTYIGAKVGKLSTDVDGLEKPMSYGIYGGYDFSDALAVEAEYGKTEKFGAKGGSGDQIKLTTMGLYGAYRMPMPSYENIYLKGKLGMTSVSSDEKDSDSNSGYTVGVGVGTHFADNIAVEAEYSLSPDIDDVKFTQLQLAGHMKF